MMTLSSTVSAGNGRTIWNRCGRCRGGRPRRGAALSMLLVRRILISPASGASTPAIMLNSVASPAPFGPITAKISPFSDVRRSLSTADAARGSAW